MAQDLALRKTTIIGRCALTLIIHSPENADVFWQVINPKTNQGWQRIRDLRHFEGKLANMKALQIFNRAIAAHRRGIKSAS